MRLTPLVDCRETTDEEGEGDEEERIGHDSVHPEHGDDRAIVACQ